MTNMLKELQDVGVDISGSLRRFVDDKKLYEKFLRRFPGNEYMEKLKNEIAVKDYDSALKSAHALKGLSANLGLDPMTEIANEMVRAFREGDNEKAVSLIFKLEEIYMKIVAIIKEN